MPEQLVIENLTVRYGDTAVVKNLDLRINAGANGSLFWVRVVAARPRYCAVSPALNDAVQVRFGLGIVWSQALAVKLHPNSAT